MYHPAESVTSTPYDTEDFEFIELTNVGSETVDLSSLSFTQGISFSFVESAMHNLAAGQVILVVKRREAFLSRYGNSLAPLVAGEYQGQLSNGGETLELSDFWQGPLLSFTYDDQWYPTTDGGGYSLIPSGLGPNVTDVLSSPDAWQPSSVIGGSPGE